MAKKNNIIDLAMWVVGVIVSIGIAGLFYNGTMLNVPILSMLGELLHQIVAWAIYASTALAVLRKLKIMK